MQKHAPVFPPFEVWDGTFPYVKKLELAWKNSDSLS